ncbi:hypothetical protein SAMN05421593_1495 [Chryseobacterium culicis]|uniref:Uncharacterized protein n=1 Tax=Chryseobacterium culicis TaxID=680127 RepID=A0A1H6HCA2_CHRCI|nr:hypothetical protein SAMN05421593_1495 [Chryseobacterium culicis]
MIINENFLPEFGTEHVGLFSKETLFNNDDTHLNFFQIKSNIPELTDGQKDDVKCNILQPVSL